MGDKLKRGVSVNVTFVDGETPTAAKFTAITSQFLNALLKVERAVGDVWDESYPYSVDTDTRLSPNYATRYVANITFGTPRTLDIANLARLIGPASNLNPHEQYRTGIVSITETIPSGVFEFQLKHPPDVTSLVFVGDSGVYSVRRATPVQMVLSGGEYCVTSDGKVYSAVASQGGTVTYNTTAQGWAGGSSYPNAAFNTLPDPNQLNSAGDGVTVGTLTGDGRYPLTLPLCTHQQWAQGQVADELDARDYNYNEQLLLPPVLVDNFSAGDRIPDGFLYLKNWSTGETYDLGEYYYNSSTVVEVGNVDLTAELARGDVFYIITVGTDITTSIDDLRRKLMEPNPRTWGGPFLDIAALANITAAPGASGGFTGSENESNFAPQYLHRDGYRTGIDEYLNDGNIMRGNLVLGYDGADAGEHVNPSGSLLDSYSLYFGSPAAATARKASIRMTALEDMVFASPGNGYRFTAGPIYPTDGVAGDPNITSEGVKFFYQDHNDVVIVKDSGTVPSAGPVRWTIDVSTLSSFTIVGYNLLLSNVGDQFHPVNAGWVDGTVDHIISWYDRTDEEIQIDADLNNSGNTSFDWNLSTPAYRLVIMYK